MSAYDLCAALYEHVNRFPRAQRTLLGRLILDEAPRMPTELTLANRLADRIQPRPTMRDTSKYRVGPDTEISDIDLEKDEVVYRGERLTEERARELAAEALAEVRRRNLIPGGKSLSGGGKHSPRVQFRIPQRLADKLTERAKAEGVSVSVLARQALEEYLKAS